MTTRAEQVGHRPYVVAGAGERYRETAGEQDEAVHRYAEALGRAARQVESIALDLVGLTLAPGSIMVCVQPVDESAKILLDLLRDELKDDGWREAGFRRDIWYANILHFAADIAHPAKLVEWVEQRRDLDLGRTVLDVVELVRFRYGDAAQGRLMRPHVLSSVRTGSSPASRAHAPSRQDREDRHDDRIVKTGP